jgi:hypothetical protein
MAHNPKPAPAERPQIDQVSPDMILAFYLPSLFNKNCGVLVKPEVKFGMEDSPSWRL